MAEIDEQSVELDRLSSYRSFDAWVEIGYIVLFIWSLLFFFIWVSIGAATPATGATMPAEFLKSAILLSLGGAIVATVFLIFKNHPNIIIRWFARVSPLIAIGLLYSL